MAIITEISSLELPAIQPFRIKRNTNAPETQGLFVAEGERIVTRLLNSQLTIVSILVTKQRFAKLSEVLNAQRFKNVNIFVVEKELMVTINGYEVHQGIMAIGKIPADVSIQQITTSKPHQPKLLVALDNVINADNVGGITRNCSGFGVDAVIAGENSCSPYYRRAVRNSMGTVFGQPVIHSTNLLATLTELRNTYGFHIYGAQAEGSKTVYEVDFNKNICLVFGNEENGISQNILELCSEKVSIPMSNNTDSLNVANASAIFLYEGLRQKKKKN